MLFDITTVQYNRCLNRGGIVFPQQTKCTFYATNERWKEWQPAPQLVIDV